MNTKKRSISNLLQFIYIVACLNFANATSNILDLKQIKSDLFSESGLLLRESNSLNSMEYHKCLIELNAIQNGLTNFEEWAIKCKFLVMIQINLFIAYNEPDSKNRFFLSSG